MRERKAARCSFISFRRFRSTAMCVILCVSASSLFLQTFCLLLLFFRPCIAGFLRLPTASGPTGGHRCIIEELITEAPPNCGGFRLVSGNIVVSEESLQSNLDANTVSYVRKFKISLLDSVSKAISSLWYLMLMITPAYMMLTVTTQCFWLALIYSKSNLSEREGIIGILLRYQKVPQKKRDSSLSLSLSLIVFVIFHRCCQAHCNNFCNEEKWGPKSI